MISIIIPTCNRTNLLRRCLESLSYERQGLSSDIYEVIVSDDSAVDGAKIIIENEFSWVKWVSGPKKGPAANRNNGAKYAKGNWLVFIDDDVIPDTRIVYIYHSYMSKRNFNVYEGCILPDNIALLKKDLSECPVNTEGGVLWSANFAINKTLFKEIGGFDEIYKIPAQEDQQMKINVEKKGEQILFLQDAIVVHPVRKMSLFSKLKSIPSQSENFAIFALKNNVYLGYNSVFQFIVKQYRFHFVCFFKLLGTLKFREQFISLSWIMFGVPLNAFFFIKFFALKERRI